MALNHACLPNSTTWARVPVISGTGILHIKNDRILSTIKIIETAACQRGPVLLTMTHIPSGFPAWSRIRERCTSTGTSDPSFLLYSFVYMPE